MKSFNDLRHKTMSRERIDRNRSEAIMSHPCLEPKRFMKARNFAKEFVRLENTTGIAAYTFCVFMAGFAFAVFLFLAE